MSEERSRQRRNAGLGVSPGAVLRTGGCLFSWASWVGFLWGLASLSVMLPSPPLSSGRPCPLQGTLMFTQHFQSCGVAPLWLLTCSMEKASDAGGIALDGERAVMLPSGHVPRALPAVPQACFPSSWQWFQREQVGHMGVPRPQAGCSQDPGKGDGSLDPGLCRMCSCRCRL